MSRKAPSLPSAFVEWQAQRRGFSTSNSRTPSPSPSDTPSDSSEMKGSPSIAPSDMKRYPMGGVPVEFPFQPYPAQIQMMAKVMQALKNKQNTLLESPTGSGKSLAILCATLAWREYEAKRLKEEAKKKKKQQSNKEKQTQVKENLSPTQPTVVEGETSGKRPLDSQDDDFRPVKLPRKLQQTDQNKAAVTIEIEDTQTPKETPPEKEPTVRVPKIYVGSRTHKQLSQLINELKGNTRYRPKMSVLGSRDQYCLHPKVSKSSDKTEEWYIKWTPTIIQITLKIDLGVSLALMDSNRCTFGSKTGKLVGSMITRKDAAQIWDIEDLRRTGKQMQGCPYFAAKTLAEAADIIFCPYNYLLDPLVRQSMEINLTGHIVILDEAHNIEDTAREAGSLETTESDMKAMQMELYQIRKNLTTSIVDDHLKLLCLPDTILRIITNESVSYNKRKSYEEYIHIWSSAQFLHELDEKGKITALTFQDLKDAYGRVKEYSDRLKRDAESRKREAAEEEKFAVDDEFNSGKQWKRYVLSNKSLRLFEGLFFILDILFDTKRGHAEDYQIALIRKVQRGPSLAKESAWVYKLAFWCLNPGVIFRDVIDKAHSVVLTSGTLSPLNTFSSELQTEFPIRLEANHVINKSQVWISTIPVGPQNVEFLGTWEKSSTFSYQDAVGEALCNISENIPYGILFFVPSYQMLDKLFQRWKVYRGKVSEGIDFTDDYCRAVVALGIPYPNVKDIQVELKRDYNDNRRKRGDNVLSGAEWYRIQAFRAINQALGRCIRHKKDWGAVILLESRFTQQNNVNQLSKWVRNICVTRPNFTEAMTDLQDFVKTRQALDQKEQEETASMLESTVS
ncbi:hypothetical protein VTP01DRAFT_2436 [Rhizomucor pusillus]|uniref:uncharacterized protein n=1 Tax=Rhizomucor pusillus TaxID=4840 RepID=UPI0037436E01